MSILSQNIIAQGDSGWKIYEQKTNHFYYGEEARVWIARGDNGQQWVVEMFVKDDANEGLHELVLCQEPLSQALHDVIDARQYDKHPEQSEALLNADRGGSLADLKNILSHALAYIEVVEAEPRQGNN